MRKSLGIKYLENPATIGEKLRNKRLELNLLQKDVASVIGTSEETITNWENNLSEPQIGIYQELLIFSAIFHTFLTQTLGGKLKDYRYMHGLSHKKMEAILNVDASTIGSWEHNEHTPKEAFRKNLNKFLYG